MSTQTFDRELRRAFDAWAPTYEADASAKIRARGYTYAELGAAIAAAIPAAPRPVLEVGVGTGILGVEVARAAGNIDLHGIDISPAMLNIAGPRGVYSQLDLAAADMFDYGLGYGLIYSSFVFHSVRDQRRFLANARAGLSRGGRLIIIDLFPAAPLEPEVGVEHSRQYEKGAPSNYIEEAEFRDFVEGLGFTVEEAHPLGERRDFYHVWYALSV